MNKNYFPHFLTLSNMWSNLRLSAFCRRCQILKHHSPVLVLTLLLSKYQLSNVHESMPWLGFLRNTDTFWEPEKKLHVWIWGWWQSKDKWSKKCYLYFEGWYIDFGQFSCVKFKHQNHKYEVFLRREFWSRRVGLRDRF